MRGIKKEEENKGTRKERKKRRKEKQDTVQDETETGGKCVKSNE